MYINICCSFRVVQKMSMQSGFLCFLLVVLGAVSVDSFPFNATENCSCNCSEHVRETPEWEKWGVPEACAQRLSICAIPFVKYAEFNETQIEEMFRRIPLARHCKDFTKMGKCVRKKIKGSSCSAVTPDFTRKFTKGLAAYDFAVNYICKENFNKMNRNRACLTSERLHTLAKVNCLSTGIDLNTICDDLPKFVDCFAKTVKKVCGREAATITRELDSVIVEEVVEIILDKECSDSAKVTKMVEKFLFRK